MRFLLVAPEDPRIDDGAARARARDRLPIPTAMRSPGLLYKDLEEDYVSALVECVELEVPRTPSTHALSDGDARVVRVRRYRSVAGVVWTTIVESDADVPLEGPTTRLESELSELAVSALGVHGAGDLLWVSRTLIHVDADGERDRAPTFRGWLERTHEQGRPTAPAYVVDDAEFTIGWGNNLLRGRRPDTILESVEASLVLAQMLWSHIHGLSGAAAASLMAGIALQPGADRRAGRVFAADVERLSHELGIQHMLTDEFTHNNQGASLSALILEDWGFPDFQRSTRRRIADLRAMAGDLRSRQQTLYQRTVEWILITIGMVALLDVAVGAVQLAFAGGVTEVPGDGSTLGFLETIRGLGADATLLVGLAAVGVLVVAVLVVITRLREDGR